MASCGGAPATAVTIVESRFESWNQFATNAFNSAEGYVQNLVDFELTFNGVSSGFTVDETVGAPFNYQSQPDVPDTKVNFSQFQVPQFPTLNEITAPDFYRAPDNEAIKPSLNIPSKPVLTTPTDPGDSPTVVDPTLPTAPDASSLLPTVPTLQDITLPTAPSITLPTFSATAPTDVPTAPNTTFSFTESSYSSTLYDDIFSNLRNWIGGARFIPDAIWNSIWDKNRSREARSNKRAKDEATIRWSSAGFSYPPGSLNANLREINQSIQDKESESSREIAIQQATFEREDLKFVVQQGIALENLTIVLFNDRMKRAFEAAKFAFQTTIDVFNAEVTLYNTQYEGFKIEADVYKTRIEAELARLEEYKAQLDAQGLIGEINNQDIALYNAQLQSVLTHIEIYKGQLAGVQAEVDINKARIDAFLGTVRVYTEKINANATLVRAYAEEIKAEMTKNDLYKTEIDAFAAEIRAYEAETDLEAKRKEIQLKWQDGQLSRYTAELERYKSQLDTEIERVKAEVSIYDGKTRIYATEISQEEARVRADTEQYRLAIEEGRADAQLQLESARTNLEYYIRTLQMELSRLDTIAKVQANLAASSLAALNVNASIGSTANDNFNYECD